MTSPNVSPCAIKMTPDCRKTRVSTKEKHQAENQFYVVEMKKTNKNQTPDEAAKEPIFFCVLHLPRGRPEMEQVFYCIFHCAISKNK